jgi:hypothetical protein
LQPSFARTPIFPWFGALERFNQFKRFIAIEALAPNEYVTHIEMPSDE